jgi:hypothetical protein
MENWRLQQELSRSSAGAQQELQSSIGSRPKWVGMSKILDKVEGHLKFPVRSSSMLGLEGLQIVNEGKSCRARASSQGEDAPALKRSNATTLNSSSARSSVGPTLAALTISSGDALALSQGTRWRVSTNVLGKELEGFLEEGTSQESQASTRDYNSQPASRSFCDKEAQSQPCESQGSAAVCADLGEPSLRTFEQKRSFFSFGDWLTNSNSRRSNAPTLETLDAPTIDAPMIDAPTLETQIDAPTHSDAPTLETQIDAPTHIGCSSLDSNDIPPGQWTPDDPPDEDSVHTLATEVDRGEDSDLSDTGGTTYTSIPEPPHGRPWVRIRTHDYELPEGFCLMMMTIAFADELEQMPSTL